MIPSIHPLTIIVQAVRPTPTNWWVPLRANNANPPNPVKLQKFPGTTKRSPSTASLPSFISSRIHLGRDLSQCRYHSPGPPSRASSKPGTRGTSKSYTQRTPIPPHRRHTSHLLICPPHYEAKKTNNPSLLTLSYEIKATTPKMVPSFVTSRLARLSRELSRPPWVLTAAIRSSLITCRR